VSAEQPLVGYDVLLKDLRQLCKDRRIGTLFVATASNKSASFTLLAGEIVGISLRTLRGRDALLLIKTIGTSRYSFADGKVADTDPDLPPTAEILEFISTPPSAPPLSAPPAPAPRQSRFNVDRVQLLLEAELVEYLGPMAKVICREHVNKAGVLTGSADLRRLIDGLAREIGDPVKEERFKREAWNKLPG
jgi:hypothetical protein